VLRTLERNFSADEGASSTTWQELAETDGGVPRRTFFRSKKKLIDAGYVVSAGTRAPCKLTDDGAALLGRCQGAKTPPDTAPMAPTGAAPSSKCQGANLVPLGAVAPNHADGAVSAKVPHSVRSGTNGTNGDGRSARSSGKKKNGAFQTYNAALDDIPELP
jgi:hypothetical protein